MGWAITPATGEKYHFNEVSHTPVITIKGYNCGAGRPPGPWALTWLYRSWPSIPKPGWKVGLAAEITLFVYPLAIKHGNWKFIYYKWYTWRFRSLGTGNINRAIVDFPVPCLPSVGLLVCFATTTVEWVGLIFVDNIYTYYLLEIPLINGYFYGVIIP